MKIVSLKTLKERNLIEIIISSLSILVGIFIIYQSIYLIYSYYFSKVLFLYMIPMTSLISELIIGLFLTFSVFFLITNNGKQTFFYKLTGILMMIFPLNEILLSMIRNGTSVKSFMLSVELLLFIIFILGLFLFLFMVQKKYAIHEEEYHYLKQDRIKVVIGLATFLLIDVSFYSWNYFD